MTADIARQHRRSIRLWGYDYSQAGAYFITICTRNRQCLFGVIVDGAMQLNNTGRIVAREWVRTAEIRQGIESDGWVVMPNHFHGILVVHERRGTARRAPTVERFGRPVSGSVPTIVRSFKSAVTKRVNELYRTSGAPLWQRNYCEHIIRNDDEMNRIRQYILDNPEQWDMDRNNPNAMQQTATIKKNVEELGI